MSIQINGIDKPKNCFDCPCIDAEFEECAAREHYLLPTDEYGAVLGDIPDWCPITELQTCEDAVSRQAAIDALAEDMPKTYTPDGSHPADEGIFMAQEIYADCIQTLKELPSVQPQRKTDEWCTDCKEYDQEKHCCPRWNRVIRQTLSEQPEIIRCKDCKHNPKLEWFGCPMTHLNEKQRPETAWCWKGERRTE